METAVTIYLTPSPLLHDVIYEVTLTLYKVSDKNTLVDS